MKRLSGRWLAGLFAGAAMSALAPARADVMVHIDKYSQRMAVSIDGYPRYSWPVSTGRSGYGTPSGVFRPQMMARRWFSRKYYNSPMPHSIFFYHGFAIHGTTELSRLGGPASHGCVRLHPSACRGAIFADRTRWPQQHADRDQLALRFALAQMVGQRQPDAMAQRGFGNVVIRIEDDGPVAGGGQLFRIQLPEGRDQIGLAVKINRVLIRLKPSRRSIRIVLPLFVAAVR